MVTAARIKRGRVESICIADLGCSLRADLGFVSCKLGMRRIASQGTPISIYSPWTKRKFPAAEHMGSADLAPIGFHCGRN